MYLQNGYPVIYKPNHQRSWSNGMIYEHILKAEEKLNRPLLKNEVVHHIDHNKENNSLDNLLIFATNQDHSRFHKTDENLNYLIQQENGSYICPIENVKHLFKKEFSNKKTTFCPLCGKKNPHSLYCIDCIRKYHPYSKNKIERNELKKLIRTMPFIVIGKQYGVSDNSIRKWCDSYGLPRRKQDIKKYSDEEWELL